MCVCVYVCVCGRDGGRADSAGEGAGLARTILSKGTEDPSGTGAVYTPAPTPLSTHAVGVDHGVQEEEGREAARAHPLLCSAPGVNTSCSCSRDSPQGWQL